MVNNDTKWGMWLNNNIYICNGIHTRYTGHAIFNCLASDLNSPEKGTIPFWGK
jgi:hypothetical protein